MKQLSGTDIIAGIFCGAILFGGILIILGATPKHQLQKDREDAINHGYAHWTVSTNGEVGFKWNNK